MPRPLTAADGVKIHSLTGGDQRLFLRIGALLEHRLGVTEAVLSEALRSEGLRKLLLDRGLSAVAVTDFSTWAQGISGSLDVVLVEEILEGRLWKVLALSDEIGNPLLSSPPATERDVVALYQALEHADLQTRLTVEALLKASSDEERAALVEKLRYRATPIGVVLELLPLLLLDGSTTVRERCLTLLTASGAHPVVVAFFRAMEDHEEGTLRELSANLVHLDENQSRIVVAGVIAHLGHGIVSDRILDLLAQWAPILAHHPGLDRLLELAIANKRAMALLPLIRALQQLDRRRVDGILQALLGRDEESDCVLFVLLIGLGDSWGASFERGLDLLLSPLDSPRERQMLAAALARSSDAPAILARLAQRRAEIPLANDSSVLWLIGDLARRRLGIEHHPILLETIITLLSQASALMQHAALTQELPLLLDGDEALKARLVDPLATITARTRDERLIDLCVHALADQGRKGREKLWRILIERPERRAREMAIRVLGNVASRCDAQEARLAVSQSLARLAELPPKSGGQSSIHERRVLLDLAAIYATEAASGNPALAAEVDTVCMEHGLAAIPALGRLAASHLLPGERRVAIVTLLVRLLFHDEATAEISAQAKEIENEDLQVLDRRLGLHTDAVPVLLVAIERILSAALTDPSSPRPAIARIFRQLAEHFTQVASWQVLWAPGQVLELVSMLVRVALAEATPLDWRRDLARRLVPHQRHPQIALALAHLVTSCQAPDLAAAGATRFLDDLAQGRFGEEEPRTLVMALIAFLAIPDLGEDAARLKRQLCTRIHERREHCGQKERQNLAPLLAELEPEIQKLLSWVG